MDPNEQRKMMLALAQQKQEEAANMYENALDNELFPVEKLSDLWKEFTPIARRKSPPFSHKVRMKEFTKAIPIYESMCTQTIEKLSLFQFGVLSNSLEAVSQDQLGLPDELYNELLTEACTHIEWYRKRTEEIRIEIEKKIDSKFQMKEAALMGKSNLKPVKAQA